MRMIVICVVTFVLWLTPSNATGNERYTKHTNKRLDKLPTNELVKYSKRPLENTLEFYIRILFSGYYTFM